MIPQLAIDTCARRLRALDGLAVRGGAGASAAITWYGPAAVPPDRRGSEACIQALCGLMEVNGRDLGAPRRLGLEVASVAAGLLAAQGSIAAEIARLRGQPIPEVQTSVLQAGLLLLSHYFVVATGLGDALPGPPLPAPGPPFCSSDGRWFEIEVLSAEPWKDFWTRLGAAEADLGRGWTVFRWRYERATCSLPEGLHEATARHSLEDLQGVAAEAKVSLTTLRALSDVVGDPGVGAARPTVRRHSGPGPAPGGQGPTPGTQPPMGRRGPASTAPTPVSPLPLPLAGIRVVEATSRIQGPFSGMLLRMLGADVVRVQPPEGDYGRAAHSLHRGKETLRLDLGTPVGRAELEDLVAEADVFLQNWRPGKSAEWGLDMDHLADRNPRLVYATASGWGDRPEGQHLLGTDFLVQAHVGLGHALHPEGEPPFPSRIILSDLFGGIVGAEAILTGLYRREQQGGAWDVRSSLLSGAMSLQEHVIEGIVHGKGTGRRQGRPLWGALDRPVPTADGTVVMSVEDDEHFRRLAEVCGIDPSGAPRATVEQRMAAHLAQGTAAAWEEQLTGAGVAAAAVCKSLADVAADPRFSHLLEAVETGGLAPRSPWSFE